MDSRRQQRQERFFLDLLARDEQNKYCADCGQKGTGWASWNIGVFLCIKCASVHRKMGPHISKVKSTKLDTWTDEQLEWIAARGNTKMNRFYNPDQGAHPFPSGAHGAGYANIVIKAGTSPDAAIEQHIRDKYERKLFVANAQVKHALAQEQQLLLEKAANANPHALELGKLEEMGFRNQAECLHALKAHQGSLTAAVEHLLKRPAGVQAAEPLKRDPLLDQLQRMGFADEALNRSTLERTGGKLGEAVELLVSLRNKTETKDGLIAATKDGLIAATEPKRENGWDADAFEFNEFVSPSGKQPSEAKPISKSEIMSLFEDINPVVPKSTVDSVESKSHTNEPVEESSTVTTKREADPNTSKESVETKSNYFHASDEFGSFSSALPPSNSTLNEHLYDKRKGSETSLDAPSNTPVDRLNDLFTGTNPWAT